MTPELFQHCWESLEAHFRKKFIEGPPKNSAEWATCDRRRFMNAIWRSVCNEEDLVMHEAYDNIVLKKGHLPTMEEFKNIVLEIGRQRRIAQGAVLDKEHDARKATARDPVKPFTPEESGVVSEGLSLYRRFSAGGMTHREYIVALRDVEQRNPGSGWGRCADEHEKRCIERNFDLDKRPRPVTPVV